MLNTKIDAAAITLAEMLDGKKFTIDDFQREYKWEQKHISQLIEDLYTAFFNNYKVGHSREDVETYNVYYMGPVVLSSKDAKLSIIDGQQRLTSMTLLLMYLNNLQGEMEGKEPVETLIYSEKFGNKSYNMQIPERINCLNALFSTGTYELDEEADDESVQNLIDRYEDVKELFPEELKGNLLPFFISWLKEKLTFVKIVTYSEENAYTIFETMNDRGLNLTPTDMLKGYLLSKIKNLKKKTEVNNDWKKRIANLHEWSQVEDLDFFKAWLRAKYADTIRPGRQGSFNEDFEKIGTTFHMWLKDKRHLAGLDKDADFLAFTEETFPFYAKLYLKIRDAREALQPGLENIYAMDWFPIASSLGNPLLMAPILESDNEETQNKKLQIVAHFLDCLAVYRSANQRTLGQSSLRYTMYSWVKEIRNKPVKELAQILKEKIDDFDVSLDGIYRFTMNQQNKRFVKYFLGRLSAYVDKNSGATSGLREYMTMPNGIPFEIEHIWADIYEYQKAEFDQKTDFQWYRNTLGGLVLLPRGTNQSFNKDPYGKKLPHYLKQNLLVQSLHPDCYAKNPNFTNWLTASGLPFNPHTDFKKKDIEERTHLYKLMAEKIWSSDKLLELAQSF